MSCGIESTDVPSKDSGETQAIHVVAPHPQRAGNVLSRTFSASRWAVLKRRFRDLIAMKFKRQANDGIIRLENGHYYMEGKLIIEIDGREICHIVKARLDTGCDGNFISKSFLINIFGLTPDIGTGEYVVNAIGGNKVFGVPYNARFGHEKHAKYTKFMLHAVEDDDDYELLLGAEMLKKLNIRLVGSRLGGFGTRVPKEKLTASQTQAAKEQQQRAVAQNEAAKEKLIREKQEKAKKASTSNGN